MRVLLIDNHDSFTYNVAHDIAVITGQLPDIVLNDAPPVEDSAVPQWLSTYDAIVVSPGPGNPECAADLGISRHAIEQAEVPVLGICLGMQAIAYDAGVPIIRAPRPVHGEVAEIHHESTGLFDTLDSPVAMVRYHSLIVDPHACAACDDLVIDARDGEIVMGLHRISRPQWGIQTHPESICSEHGRELLARFFAQAEAWGRRQAAPAPWRLYARRVSTPACAETIFDQLFRGDDYAWWLDTATGDGVSVCGSGVGPLARVVEADGVLDRIEQTLGAVQVIDLGDEGLEAADLPFTPGWVGYLGYEAEASVFVFADRAVAVVDAQAWVLALSDENVKTCQHEWVNATAERLRGMSAQPPTLPAPPAIGELKLRHGRADYLELIDKCQEKIAAGESYELCLTNHIRVETRSDPWQLYRRLRTLSPRPYAAYLAFSGCHVLSASPERFLKVDARGHVEAKPIKGTRRRSEDTAEDKRLAGELLSSVKERAENLMIVDLLRNDLSRVCVPGSVHVPLLFDVETHTGAHQLVSTIRGTLAKPYGALDAVRAAFPGGSMTGAPKERSMEILRTLEAGPRGVYSGALGYISVDGTVDLSIVIRTIVHHADHLEFGMGGAITARSDAAEEWEETLVKARTLGVALGMDLDDHLNAF
ncbi:aminodeoxychorismate synthase component I [Corynebacterium yudongzhengii]|uniref:aminodeoxychorismate synthase n=1 Tax=Corynebacterium yudongzhengii TaxID=2080740 RepID=A0A2U1T8P0_9CORY|nr:aminodeoxychorismate synthase component I [Corynebacterium yudongzhengii]AWB81959.1 aminodeoxychorismate synthase component I [Corynebacterium yudongzhengii]PWC02352.1 aminodeoxychorismate synthase component I [Corynebacterium yudongzhengii]